MELIFSYTTRHFHPVLEQQKKKSTIDTKQLMASAIVDLIVGIALLLIDKFLI